MGHQALTAHQEDVPHARPRPLQRLPMPPSGRCCLRLVNSRLWVEPLEMCSLPVLFPVLLEADTNPLLRAVAAYLARFKDATRVHTESDLRAFLVWCAERRLPPLDAQRVHVELYVRWMQEVRRFKPSTLSRRTSCIHLTYSSTWTRWASRGGSRRSVHQTRNARRSDSERPQVGLGMNAGGVLEPREISSNSPQQRVGIGRQQHGEQNRLCTHIQRLDPWPRVHQARSHPQSAPRHDRDPASKSAV